MSITQDDVRAWLLPIRMAGQVAAAPNGRAFAYTVSGTDAATLQPTVALWLATIDGGEHRRLTEGRITSPSWLPSGDAIVFADEHSLVRFTIASGERTVIATHDTAIEQVAVAPHGRTAAWVGRVTPPAAELPGGLAPVHVITRQDYKEDGVGLPNDSHRHLFLTDLASGDTRQLSTEHTDHGDIAWSSDGRWLAALGETRGAFRNRLVVFDAVAGTSRWMGEPEAAFASHAWIPGTRHLVALRRTREPLTFGPVIVDTDTGATTTVPNPDEFAHAMTSHAIAVPDATQAHITAYWWGRSARYRLDLVSLALRRECVTDDMRGSISACGRSHLIQERSGPDSIGELIGIDLQTGAEQPLTQLNGPHLAQRRPGRIEQRSVRHEGQDVPYLFKVPHDFDPARRYPVVFEIHGGPSMLRGHAIEDSNQLLLDAGYLVVNPNPRGSTSWGLDYMAGVFADWGGGDWQDDLAVVDEVATLPFVDPDRLGIYGYSYGGYMTSWAIGQTNRFRAAVIGAPLTDLISRDGTVDIATGSPAWEFRGEMPALREFLIERSPITWAHRATTPTLILHPEDDQRCAIGQSEQLFHVLKRAGVETAFVRYPGQSHLMPWAGPMAYRLDYLWRVVDWFQRHCPAT